MGFVPQCKLRDYWQVKNVITQTPAFHQVMYKNHWCAIWTLCLPEFKKFFAIYFAIVPSGRIRATRCSYQLRLTGAVSQINLAMMPLAQVTFGLDHVHNDHV